MTETSFDEVSFFETVICFFARWWPAWRLDVNLTCLFYLSFFLLNASSLLSRACKKEFACNGTVVEHPEYGEVLQLQGDQRENICQFLTKTGLVKQDQLKVHGF